MVSIGADFLSQLQIVCGILDLLVAPVQNLGVTYCGYDILVSNGLHEPTPPVPHWPTLYNYILRKG